MKCFVILALLALISSLGAGPRCHPRCTWTCSEPKFPAICDPVCQPPVCNNICHSKQTSCKTSCSAPKCQVKCPVGQCSTKGCPKCVNICDKPICRTVCTQPICETVCKEPVCDWTCHKPSNVPKPKCHLKCENPKCTPKKECCHCSQGGMLLGAKLPMFKSTEISPNCCGCNKNNNLNTSQRVPLPPNSVNTKYGHEVYDFGTHIEENHRKDEIMPFDAPRPIGDSYAETPTRLIESFETKHPIYNIGEVQQEQPTRPPIASMQQLKAPQV